jgi:hypothetical protein
MSIKCLGFKSVKKGTLVGIAHLSFTKAGIDIYGCTLHMKDGKRWVSLPVKEYADKESGEIKHIPVVRIPDKRLYGAFCTAAKKAIDDWCKINSS